MFLSDIDMNPGQSPILGGQRTLIGLSIKGTDMTIFLYCQSRIELRCYLGVPLVKRWLYKLSMAIGICTKQ
jgi:hypothetical protein